MGAKLYYYTHKQTFVYCEKLVCVLETIDFMCEKFRQSFTFDLAGGVYHNCVMKITIFLSPYWKLGSVMTQTLFFFMSER